MFARLTGRFGQRRSLILIGVQLLLVIALLKAVAGFREPVNGFSQLIMFGSDFAEQALPEIREIPHAVVENSPGYDGQFYAQMAMDPLIRDPNLPGAMDSPGYRFRRILMPMAAYLVGFGQPGRIVQAIALFNVFCWLVLAVILLRWFKPGDGGGVLRWIGVLFGAGLLYSIRFALPDGPALLLIALALMLAEVQRAKAGALALAMAVLTRETSILGFAVLPSKKVWQKGWLSNLISFAAIVLLPMALWMLYVNSRTAVPGLEANLGAGNFRLPCVGFGMAWVDTFRWDDWVSRAWFGRFAALAGVSVQMLFFLTRWRWRERAWRLGFSFALLGLVLGPAVWEGPDPAAIRVLVPLSLAFNLCVPHGRTWVPLLLAGNLSVVAAPWILDAPPSVDQSGISDGLVRVHGSAELLAREGASRWEIQYSQDWLQMEYSGERTWRWAPGSVSITLLNRTGGPVDSTIRLDVQAREACHLELALDEQNLWSGDVARESRVIEFPCHLGPGASEIEFRTSELPVRASWQDGRMLLFRLNAFEVDLIDRVSTRE